MPIDFPASPTNGQVYGTYVYDSSITAWRNLNTDAGATQLATSVGLRNIVPTSIAKGASGSASVNSNGTVSFTATESVSLNGVFSSAYTKYLLKIDVSSAADSGIQLRYRAAGVDSSTSDYVRQIIYANNATAGASKATANNLDLSITGATRASLIELNVYNVATTSWTTALKVHGSYNLDFSSMAASTGIFTHRVATAYDGITLYPGVATNITGTFQVLAYNS